MEVSAPFEKIVKLSKDYLGVIAGNKLYCFNRKSECFTPVISGKETDGVRLWGLLPLNETSFGLYSKINYCCINGKSIKISQAMQTLFVRTFRRSLSYYPQKENFFLLFALMKIEGCVWLPISVTCCYFIRIVRSCAGR